MSFWNFFRRDDDDDRFESRSRDSDDQHESRDRYDDDDDDRYESTDGYDDDDHNGDDRHDNDSDDVQEAYQFTVTNGTVTAVYEIENGRSEYERIEANESWSIDGTDIVKTEAEHGQLEISTYSDPDGDGLYTLASKVYESATPGTLPSTTGDDRFSHDDGDHRSDDDFGFEDDDAFAPAPALPSVYHTFEFVDGEVVAASRVVNDIARDIRLDWNESWELRSDGVAKVELGRNDVETTLYTDDDFDGAFTQSLELEVVTQTSRGDHEDMRFVLSNGTDATGANLMQGDMIDSALEATFRGGWSVERLDQNETLKAIELDGALYVVKTEVERIGETEFSLYRDDDADGRWTEIAEGSAMGEFLDETGGIDFARIEYVGLLADSYGIIA